ncbi:CapA family protein [Peptoniphilus sp. MSJ-1]|uniref:CapA family protein n=1 Tax=Peptoniphilus ovalis TaxID=2841503 RepID=A0ABS6FIP8_9FIRM|nr:CapA family protein [Peptoniphilus ovalis]MBU5670044.1 CapA family protein [Peptoniphilus ovalis]
MKNFKYIFISFVILVLTAGLFIIGSNYNNIMGNKKEIIENKKEITPNKKDKKEIPQKSRVEIFAMGDMIFHRPIVKNYAVENSYDFTPIFNNISGEIKSVDIAVANFEGSVNSNRALSGFPLFNFPKESIYSLKNVGFDVLSTSNNHALDTGIDGVHETINHIKESGMEVFGTLKEDSVDKGIVIEKNGIKIGFISFTDTLNGMDSLMNGREYSVNTFGQDFMTDISNLKAKSDIVIVYPHWGNEYQFRPTERQIFLKDNMQQAGADIILGSHPHVLQRYEVEDRDNKKFFTIYSMGNALSNQRVVNLKKKGVETGVFVKLIVEKDLNSNVTKLVEYGVYPTMVNRYHGGRGLIYDVVKLEDLMDGGRLSDTATESLRRDAANKYTEAIKVLKGEI